MGFLGVTMELSSVHFPVQATYFFSGMLCDLFPETHNCHRSFISPLYISLVQGQPEPQHWGISTLPPRASGGACKAWGSPGPFCGTFPPWLSVVYDVFAAPGFSVSGGASPW